MLPLLLSALILGQELEKPPPGPQKARISAKLSIEQEGSEWRFRVDGTTDLPDGAKLKSKLYVLEEVENFRGGKRIDETAVDYESRPVEIVVKAGKFDGVIFTTARQPYSLRYRAKMTFDPEGQEEEVAEKVDEKLFTIFAEHRRGNDEAFVMEVDGAQKELAADMESLLSIFRELKKQLMPWIAKPDKPAYLAWYKGIRERLDGIEERNQQRFSIWAVWIEYQGKMRITRLGEWIVRICREFETYMDGPAEGREEQLKLIRGLLEDFLPSYEESREVLGIDTPWDPETVGAIVREYERSVAAIREAAASEAAWKEKSGPARDQARRCLMKLVGEKLIPRRAYDRVTSLAGLLLETAAAAGRAASGAEGAKAELEEKSKAHDEKLKEFKRYAGLGPEASR